MVAEAQVFKPERDEFDEIIDLRLMTYFSDKFTFRSPKFVRGRYRNQDRYVTQPIK
ncbi:capsid portal protein [Vibrio phage J14]|nr:capsid portal protein [Vibrio phage J14]